MNRKLHGIYPAIVVPFDANLEIDEPGLRSLARWLASVEGVSGLVCNGHAGEVTSLSRGERQRVVRILVEEAGNKLPIFSGINSESTSEAVEFARDIKEAGGSGVLLMPIHSWLRFGRQQGAPEAYFKAVASVGLPIIVHQYPAWTKAHYSAETLLALAQIPQVVAVKMGERDLSRYEYHVRILRERAPHISLLSCHDEFLFPTLVHGMDGALVGFASIVPELITALFDAVQKQDLERAAAINDRIFPLKEAVYGQEEPSGAAHARGKEMLRQLGRIERADVRPPVFSASEGEAQLVREALLKAGLVKADTPAR